MVSAVERKSEALFGQHWGWMAFRGLAAILFGIFTLAWPAMTLIALIIAYGAYTLVDGIASLFFAARGGKTRTGKTWPLVLTGLAGIGAGLVAFLWPALTALVLLYIVAIWALARGLFEVVAYFPLRDAIDNAWLVMVSGLLSIAFGLLLLFMPVPGILATLWLVGIYAIAVGAALIGLAVSIRSTRKERQPSEPRRAPPAEPTPA